MSADEMQSPLKGRRCLVTGGSRGLGRAICKALGAAGARVAFTHVRDAAAANQTRAEVVAQGADCLVYNGSVADAGHAEETTQAIVREWGGIDVLINNAGINQLYPLALIETRDWDTIMEVNARGAFLFSRAAARTMIKARKGHILNIGSFASERLVESPVHYASAKSALRGLTESMAMEVGRYNILVNMLSPGLMDQGMSTGLPKHRVVDYEKQCPLGRVATVDEIARMALFLVSDDNTFMTGAKIVMDGGI
jgi:3-oxoacyl-[acyl-carrier protein] reductase